jgi:hypothetical protein
MNRVMIVFTVPETHLDAVLQAMGEAGAGVIGSYTFCSFASAGSGRFRPNADANPALGTREQINVEPEIRVETFCDRERAKTVVEAIRRAHPYEEPVIYLLALLDEAAL